MAEPDRIHSEGTELQSDTARRQAQDLSLRRTQPPTNVPGYETQKLLGVGAFGEVWVALDRNTGRQVAIKFYSRSSGLDWSQLSREVEKLVFLSADRYVVQLLDVGWDAEPPYYVMEYVEHGSLDDQLRRDGPMKPDEAVAIFHDVATGLLHAHGKGVLHCDLKPANVLLDEDRRPRIADFGQARLSHEQQSSLGTMFYMAPEQADLKAVPDACWDVYALGALLYTMLTGAPPYRDDETVKTLEKSADLERRLEQYRELIEESPRPSDHRKVPGIDPELVEIIDRCLAVDPGERFPNVQSVLDALSARDRRRQRRPLMLLGAIGPAVLLAVVGLFAWLGAESVVNQSVNALTESEVSTNRFAAQYVAKAVANQLQRRMQAVERVAADPEAQRMLEELNVYGGMVKLDAERDNPELTDEERVQLNERYSWFKERAKELKSPDYPELTKAQLTEMAELRLRLNDPKLNEDQLEPLREEYRNHPAYAPIQDYINKLSIDEDQPEVASWFMNDSAGLQLAREPVSKTIGRNYAWRTYFSGLDEDQDPSWRPEFVAEFLWTTRLSPVFRSQATGKWIVAISTPIRTGDEDAELLGVIALTVEVGKLVELAGGSEQFAVLVDAREGKNSGLILQHPLFETLMEKEGGKLPGRFQSFRVLPDQIPNSSEQQRNYRDPLAEDIDGDPYDRRWIAASEPVKIGDDETGWKVIVQKSYDAAIGQTLSDLRASLVMRGLLAALLVAVVLTVLWVVVLRLL